MHAFSKTRDVDFIGTCIHQKALVFSNWCGCSTPPSFEWSYDP